MSFSIARHPRRVAMLLAMLLAISLAPRTASAQGATDRNIVVISADDTFWAYYGFMQRWLRSKVAGNTLGRAYENDPGAGEQVGDRRGIVTRRHVGARRDTSDRPAHHACPRLACRRGTVLPRGALGRVDLHARVRDHAHRIASARPAEEAGLNGGMERQSRAAGVASRVPVGRAVDPTTIAPPPDVNADRFYLSMAAGKWKRSTSHIHFATGDEKSPWDRALVLDGEGALGRDIVTLPAHNTPRALEPVKDSSNARCATRRSSRATMGRSAGAAPGEGVPANVSRTAAGSLPRGSITTAPVSMPGARSAAGPSLSSSSSAPTFRTPTTRRAISIRSANGSNAEAVDQDRVHRPHTTTRTQERVLQAVGRLLQQHARALGAHRLPKLHLREGHAQDGIPTPASTRTRTSTPPPTGRSPARASSSSS